MTRDEMAQGLAQHEDECPSARCGICGARNDDETHSDKSHCFVPDEDSPLLLAAVALRQECATCQHFITTEGYRNGRETHPPIASCVSWRSPVPIDGSGFCHRWEPK